jgi:hypothetical protein
MLWAVIAGYREPVASNTARMRPENPLTTNTDAHSPNAAMIEPNQTAFILKVTLPDEAEPSGQLVIFYAAITTSEDEALAIVRQAVKADAAVEPTGVRLSQQTASALVLEAGLARAL